MKTPWILNPALSDLVAGSFPLDQKDLLAAVRSWLVFLQHSFCKCISMDCHIEFDNFDQKIKASITFDIMFNISSGSFCP